MVENLTLDNLNILNSKKEDQIHLLKPAQFAYLTKYTALIPRDFFPSKIPAEAAEDN